MAIVDATRSVAAKSLQLTGLGETLEVYAPSLAASLESAKTALSTYVLGGWPLSNVIDYVNEIPLALLAAGLFLLIYALASRNRATRHF